MKKWISLFLAITLLSAFACNASAEEWGYEPDELIDVDIPDVGMTLMIPVSFYYDTVGSFDIMEASELGYKSGVYYTLLGYTGMSTEERKAIGFDEDYFAPLMEIICLKDGFDEDVFYDADLNVNWENAWSLGGVGEYSFFVIFNNEELPSGFRSPFIEEYYSLLDRSAEILENTIFYQPENPNEKNIGTEVAFYTEDLYGNSVNSEDLFSANEITMVNIWATWCGHCIEELPQLEQIHNRLQNIGCGIIGVLEDSNEDDAVEEAKQLIWDTGVTYPVVKMTDEMEEAFPSNALPTSYFVNRNGEIIGIPVEGALVDKYYEAVEDLLAGGTETDIVTTSPGEIPGVSDYESQNFIPASDENSTYPNGASADRGNAAEYRIICVDENGQPVAGCTVQFCSDDTCLLGKTDENGIAAFQEPPGHYTVHLLKPPAGYAKDSTEYTAPEVYGDVIITLEAA